MIDASTFLANIGYVVPSTTYGIDRFFELLFTLLMRKFMVMNRVLEEKSVITSTEFVVNTAPLMNIFGKEVDGKANNEN